MSLRTNSPGEKSRARTTNSETKLSSNPELTIRLDTQRESPKLSCIDMFIGDEGAIILSKYLSENTNFEYLEIRGNNISAVGFSAICDGLRGARRIKSISAEWNQIGSDPSGLIALNELIRTKSTIVSLDLRNNHIGYNSAGSISNIIKECETLQNLDLRWNDLGDDGAKTILAALRTCQRKI